MFYSFMFHRNIGVWFQQIKQNMSEIAKIMEFTQVVWNYAQHYVKFVFVV